MIGGDGMAIKINNKDITTVHCPGGAEAQAVRIHNGTSWIDVWMNIKIMTLVSSGITKGFSNLSTDKRTLSLYKVSGSMEGGGTIIVYLEGTWTNPAITFDWQGAFQYNINGTWYNTPSGSISLYHRLKGASSAGTTTAVSSVGSTVTGSSTQMFTGTYSGSLSGTYDRIGLSIYMSSFSGTFNNSFMELTVKNFNIGTQKVGFPDALIYNYM